MFVAVAVISWVIVFIASIIFIVGGIVILISGNLEEGNFLESWKNFLYNQVLGVKALDPGTDPAWGYEFFNFILPILYVVFGAVLISICIIEFVRIKKRQKISLPFIKVLIILVIIVCFIFGNLFAIVSAILLIVALVMMEIILFDVEAINNYSEERNLMIIYKEEKKFEKEVNKEGRRSWKKRFGTWDSKKEMGTNKYKKTYFEDEKEW
ncbi:hypothetical protein [Spiroplasma alleghenense]|uniref:Transmembrane protein n=1 Tax=Spiroplasma alleghenense TaxID=216931 RepID=A0A345Z2U2_9MOLU|nr:hypothetical protein [Spiroplasma alleghenense]AXK50921.1 hypothetical protein SALLE_v1c02450 [Spiroplasma alleghenense]